MLNFTLVEVEYFQLFTYIYTWYFLFCYSDHIMATQPNIITVQAAAKEKSCTRQALYKALTEGRLQEIRMGATRLILKNRKYRNFEARKYADKRDIKPQQKGA